MKERKKECKNAEESFFLLLRVDGLIGFWLERRRKREREREKRERETKREEKGDAKREKNFPS